MKSFDVLTGDQELEVRTATHGPETDQSRHAKSVSQIRYIEFLSQALKFHYIKKYSKKVNTLKSKALKVRKCKTVENLVSFKKRFFLKKRRFGFPSKKA